MSITYQHLAWGKWNFHLTFHDGGRYHIGTSPLRNCRANQLTGFYMITASVMKGLKVESKVL